MAMKHQPPRATYAPPQKAGFNSRPYQGKPILNKPLIRPYFWGGGVRGPGGPGWLVDQP